MSEAIIVISFVQDVKGNDRIRWQLLRQLHKNKVR